MSSFPPLTVAVRGPRPSCVIDVPLALCTGGLLFSLRLAAEANVFLGRELWYTLDNMDLLASEDNSEWQGDTPLWKLARLDNHMNQLGLYWAGESRRESLLPDDQDKQFLQRYEILARALDDQAGDDGETWLAEDSNRASRDTLAVAGALMPYRPIIFTCSAARSPLMGYLEQRLTLRGIPAAAAEQAREYFRPMFLRTGISELLWHGLELTAIHLVAPRALVLPAEEPNKAQYDVRWGRWQYLEPEVDGWDGAAAYWYAISEVAE